MLAVRYSASDGLVVDPNYSTPKPAKDEALIQVSTIGICSTDLELVKGYFGFSGVLGHEFVGKVIACEDSKWMNQRVVGSINFADKSSLEYAEYGLEHHPHRKVLGILNHDGAMAEYVVVPTQNLFAVPESVTDREAVFAEPLAAALRIAQQVICDPNEPACVIGPGRLGMLIGRTLALQGRQVRMAGRQQGSLKLAENWGLATSLVKDLESSSYHFVVEATGNPDALADAIRITRPLGKIVLKSTFEGAQQTDLTKLVVDEIQLIGSRCGPFAPSLALLKSGSIAVQELIDDVYPLDQAERAMRRAAEPGVRKVLLEVGDVTS